MLIKMIDIYQSINGPWHDACRHIPTCSSYMKEAIIVHGSLKGLGLGFKRLLRCTPWGTYGYDPVPRKEQVHEKKV